MKILLTGSTGYLGRYLVPLLAQKAEKIFLLVRKSSLTRAMQQFSSTKYPNIYFIVGDMTYPQVVESEDDLKVLQKEEIDTVIHSAALYDLMASEKECYINNVLGTQMMLALLREFPHVQHFHYISSIAVAGNHQGRFYEGELECGQHFSNYYAQTKYEAEKLVRLYTEKKVCRHVYRLGVLVGDSNTGEMTKVDGPYFLFPSLQLIKQYQPWVNHLKYCPLPMNPESLFPLIPVDEAARVVGQMVEKPMNRSLQTFHILGSTLPTMQIFLKDCLEAMEIPLDPFPIPPNTMNSFLCRFFHLPTQLLEYAYSETIYDQAIFQKSYPSLQTKSYEEFKEPFFRYVRKLWLTTKV